MSEWIPVKERLPEPIDVLPQFSRRVLISTYLGCFTAQYDFENKVWLDEAIRAWIQKPFFMDGLGWQFPAIQYDESMGVTHWMDLPEQPEEESV